jgi:hypothetical protein
MGSHPANQGLRGLGRGRGRGTYPRGGGIRSNAPYMDYPGGTSDSWRSRGRSRGQEYSWPSEEVARIPTGPAAWRGSPGQARAQLQPMLIPPARITSKQCGSPPPPRLSKSATGSRGQEEGQPTVSTAGLAMRQEVAVMTGYGSDEEEFSLTKL